MIGRRGVLAGTTALIAGCRRATSSPLTLFAAASLTDAVTELAAKFQAEGGGALRTVFAGSGELARQLLAGAPADLVVLADDLWMGRLAREGAIRVDSQVTLLTNSLVVIAPSDRPVASFAWDGRVAIGDPESVPAGRYAREMLQRSGVWDTVSANLILAGDVRAVRAFVARGEVDLGIVYRSDALGFDAARVVNVPVAALQPDIAYPAALTATAARQTVTLMAFLRSQAAGVVFTRHGFGPGR